MFWKKSKKINLSDFSKRVGELAAKYGEGYYNVSCTMQHYRGGKVDVMLTGYINGFNHCIAPTIDEVIQKLEAMKNPKVSSIEDVTLPIEL